MLLNTEAISPPTQQLWPGPAPCYPLHQHRPAGAPGFGGIATSVTGNNMVLLGPSWERTEQQCDCLGNALY